MALCLEDGAFGDAGRTVVVEEFMTGEELSFFALSDGVSALAFGAAQDHKTVWDGDRGPNTGGMGAYSPAPVFDAAVAGARDGGDRAPHDRRAGQGGLSRIRACSTSAS